MSLAIDKEDQISPPFSTLPVTLRVKESFEEFVQLNPDLVVEQNANGEIVIMSPTGGDTSDLNAELTFQLRAWSKQFGGTTFDSSIIFCLPDSSKRSPDASWISSERWSALSPEDRKSFPPISPDFVIELRSATDTLRELQVKMQNYMKNGIRLGWLIDPSKCQVHIYQPDKPVEVLTSPDSVSNEETLPGFVLDLKPIWKK